MCIWVSLFAHLHIFWTGDLFYVLSCIFFQLQWVARSSLRGCAHAHVYLHTRLSLFVRFTSRLPLLSKYKLIFSTEWRSDSLRWIPWENVVLLSTLLRIAKLSTPADPSSLFSSEKRKQPGTSRHQQSRQADCLSSAVLLIPFALEWTELLWLLKTYFYLMIVLIIHLPGTINGIDLDLHFEHN